MTPQLKQEIERITCPTCLGEGKLGNSHTVTQFSCERVQHWQDTCDACCGTGMRSRFPLRAV